jgi:hypothetical protein
LNDAHLDPVPKQAGRRPKARLLTLDHLDGKRHALSAVAGCKNWMTLSCTFVVSVAASPRFAMASA